MDHPNHDADSEHNVASDVEVVAEGPQQNEEIAGQLIGPQHHRQEGEMWLT